MELIYVTVIGAAMGLALRYLIPGRHAYGIMLTPAVGGIVSAVVWEALTWLGWKYDGGWIWVITLLAAGLASIATAVIAPRIRHAEDARLLHELSGGRA